MTTSEKIFDKIDTINNRIGGIETEVAVIKAKLEQKINPDWVKIIRVIGIVALPIIGLITGHQVSLD
ncbi:hypothetical protein KAR91_53355 [Candidatus Pacearchaeota archaeon]|nr:hypothetical protein [Candidatus Pacearchaeota archaeon]